MSKKSMTNKPKKQTLSYYDWDHVKSYMVKSKIWNEEDADEFWSNLCKNEEIHKESPITITDWELKYDNGKYSRSVDKNQKRFITELLKEFGEPDSNCLTPGVLTMRMIATW